MSRLDELIKKLCPNGVVYKKIKDVCAEIIVPMRDRPKVFDGNIPWCRIEDKEGQYFHKSLSGLGVSQEVINKMNLKVFPEGTVICSCSASIGHYAINTQPLITNQTFIGLVCGEHLYNKYLLYFMETQTKILKSLTTTGTIPYISRKKFEELLVPVPPLEIQEEIVKILDKFTNYVIELQAELQARIQQYEYYKEKLLVTAEDCDELTLEEVCSVITDGAHTSPRASENGYYMPSVKDMRANGFDYSSCKIISENDYNDLVRNGCKPQMNDVLIAKDGSMLKYAFVSDGKDEIVVLSSIAILRPKIDIINPKYLAHLFRRERFKEIVIRDYSSKGGVPRIVLKNFKKIKIKVPSLLKQQEIVDVLDKFEKLVGDIKCGIPAEIEARQKQYEYYRDKLLTFKELS